MSKRGRPKQTKEFQQLDFTTFQLEITMFRDYLIDIVNDEEEETTNEPFLRRFLDMEIWKQNLLIVYILNKDKRTSNKSFSFKGLAKMLLVDRAELMRLIRDIRNELVK